MGISFGFQISFQLQIFFFLNCVSVKTVLWESLKCVGGTSAIRNSRNASLES